MSRGSSANDKFWRGSSSFDCFVRDGRSLPDGRRPYRDRRPRMRIKQAWQQQFGGSWYFSHRLKIRPSRQARIIHETRAIAYYETKQPEDTTHRSETPSSLQSFPKARWGFCPTAGSQMRFGPAVDVTSRTKRGLANCGSCGRAGIPPALG
jgi:hypothetical protein